VPVRQQALTVVAPVERAARAGLAARLSAIEPDVCTALTSVKSLHFARFVLLDGPDGPASRLAFEASHDGERAQLVTELSVALAPFEATLCGAWAGYHSGDLASFVEANARPATTFYLGHPGLSVQRILDDATVRDRLESLLDDAQTSGRLAGKSFVEVREALLAALPIPGQPAIVLGPVDRGLPRQPQAEEEFAVVVLAVLLLAVFVIPAALVVEWRERSTEAPAQLVAEDDPRLDSILAREDAFALNGLTHHVPMRPGRLRRSALRLVLWFLEQARQKVAYKGTLGDISSIHFARWVLLEDQTVLFFSNYDGSWESYLGDFVDKAHIYLSAVWSNTKWFPPTVGLIFGGASKESTFKRWVRTFQVENQIWYSAYPHITVSNVLANAKVREGAAGPMTEEQARAWLACL
jgi:hypothetical protein